MTTSELKAELDKHPLDVPVEILIGECGPEFEIESINDRHYFDKGFRLTIVVKKKGETWQRKTAENVPIKAQISVRYLQNSI